MAKKLKKGILLLSQPFMEDPNFHRTVVLLAEHAEEGSVGFVLNQLFPHATLKDVYPQLSTFDAPVYVGGPVQQDTLHFIHRDERIPEAIPVGKGLFWGGHFDRMVEMALEGELDPADFRFFLGYSGWSPGQLEAEMAERSWIICPAKKKLIFDEELIDNELWQEVLRSMGERYKALSNFPTDPSLN